MFLVKHCSDCGGDKEDDEFGRDAGRPGGRSAYCLACKARRQREYRARVDERPRNRQRYRAAPEQWKAKVCVARAVARGALIVPAACEHCEKARKLEAHHYLGYEREHWLDVEWVCRPCHKLADVRRLRSVQVELAVA